MNKNLDALWLEEMEPHVDGKIIWYLRTHHERYGKLLLKHEELLKPPQSNGMLRNSGSRNM